jgi:REP element-mobilizing transposase RayT
MTDTFAVLITWTTYGTWLPGDSRGWRKRVGGHQLPSPLLEAWCRKQMKGQAVLLGAKDREAVESACYEHCRHRGWSLLAVNARSNHVHIVVVTDLSPQKTRDQLKANATRSLRQQAEPLIAERTWTSGGDCEILDNDDDMYNAVRYVMEGQNATEISLSPTPIPKTGQQFD